MSGLDVARRLVEGEPGVRLGAGVCNAIAREGTVVEVGEDDPVFLEGEEARAFYIVLSGGLKIVRETEQGREIIFHLAHPVQMIAEAAYFLGRYPATGIATEPTRLLKLSREGVERLMDAHPGFLRWMFDAMGVWLRKLLELIDRLTVGDVTVRLARYLLEEEQRADGPAFRLPVSKGELARLLNMNQATLSRCLRRLAEEGLLGMDGKRIHIPDREALRLRAFPPSL